MKTKRIIGLLLSMVLAFSSISILSITAQTNSITITTASPWFEGGYVEWTDSLSASSYNVYYKKADDGESSYQKIDSELIRNKRADILGLIGDIKYDIKIVPVINTLEDTANQTVTQITPMKYDRSGFAFSQKSPHKNTTGGYNIDGSIKENAKIYYVSEQTKDTIKDTIIKGSSSTECTGIGEIMKARESAKSTDPVVIRIIGKVTPPKGVDSLSLLNLKNVQNITVEGIGEDTLLTGWGLNIRNASNIEIRNLAFEDFPDDSVSMQTDNANIWIHNNDFHIGRNGGGDKSKGDGSCDIKDDTTYVTVSYNHFHSTGKTSLCGMKSETPGVGFVTYHHNWYDKSGSRHPRIRTITVHSYNNYYDHNYSGGIGITTGASAFLENNYFEDVVRPVFSAGQGNDIKEDGSSFSSGENGGVIKSFGNTFTTCGKSVTYIDSKLNKVTKACTGCTYFNGGGREINPSLPNTQQPDCYNAESRDEIVPSSFYAFKGNTTYNNFDTSADMYEYTPDTPEVAKAKAVEYAGRVRNLDPKMPPKAPQNPSVSIDDEGNVTLSWDMVTEADYYNLSYSVDGEVKGSNIISEETSYSIPELKLAENQKVTFDVSSVKKNGEENIIGTSSRGEASYVAPQPPTGLKLTVGNALILGEWNASQGASSYEVSLSDGDLIIGPFTTTDLSYSFEELTDGKTYTFSVKAKTGHLSSSAVTANATAVCYISESGLDYTVVDDNFDEIDDSTGLSYDLGNYTFDYDTANSSLDVTSNNGALIIKDNSETLAVKISRNITPIKSGRFVYSFDITFGEKPNGVNDFIKLMSGNDIVFALTINSQNLYINSGDKATVSSGAPVGNTKLVGSKISAGQTIKLKIVGDIDKKIYDLYAQSPNKPDAMSYPLVLSESFSQTGINRFELQTSTTKVHNYTIDNFSVLATEIDGEIIETLKKPSDVKINFDIETKMASVSWAADAKAESYDLIYEVNGEKISDTKCLNLTESNYTIPNITFKNGDVLKCTISAKSEKAGESAKAVISKIYSDGTETTTDPVVETTSNTLENTTKPDTPISGVKYGDVNEDGEINFADAASVLQYTLNNDTLFDKFNEKAADVSADMDITALDASMILRYALGSFEFPNDGFVDSSGGNTPNPPSPSGGKAWDFGTFDAAAISAIVESSPLLQDGLTIYKPASALTADKVTATDGTQLNAKLKINKLSSALTKAPTKNAFAVNVSAGDKITVYFAAGKDSETASIVFVEADTFVSSDMFNVTGKKPTPVTYTAKTSGTYYIHATASVNPYIYKISINQ